MTENTLKHRGSQKCLKPELLVHKPELLSEINRITVSNKVNISLCIYSLYWIEEDVFIGKGNFPD